MSSQESKIDDLLERLRTENLTLRSPPLSGIPNGPPRGSSRRPNRPNLACRCLVHYFQNIT